MDWLLFQNNPTVVYTIFAGLFIANIIMLILGFSCIRIFTRVLAIPKPILTPIIFVLCVVGSYAISNNFFDVGVMLVSGIIGYFMIKVEIPPSPMILGMILGSMAENHFRTALLKSGGHLGVFFESGISIFLAMMVAVTLLAPLLQKLRQRLTKLNSRSK